jgi:L-ascorbate metabolism protein UlaG (beta-lactamase superfamily)
MKIGQARVTAILAVVWLAFFSPAVARAADLACIRPPPPRVGEVRVRFMGVSTLLIEDQQTQILLDGFFTRPDAFAVKFGRVAPNPVRIAYGLCHGGVGNPVAVFTAHAHFDHAMDAAEIVAERGGKLVGSPSVAEIGRSGGLQEPQIEAFEGRKTWNVGCFRVTAIPSPHSSPDRWEGEITHRLRFPSKVSEYRNGGTFSYLFERAGLKILAHPSAAAQPGIYAGQRADVVFLGIGGLGVKDRAVAEALWKEVVVQTHPRAVYPIHWDNFTRTLDKPLKPVPWPFDNVSRTRRRLAGLAQRDGPQIVTPELFAAISLLETAPDSTCAPADAGRFEAVG